MVMLPEIWGKTLDPLMVDNTDLIILTHDAREGTMNEVLARLQALPTVLAPITRIRKEELA